MVGGLWAFPSIECEHTTDLADCLARGLREDWGLEAVVGEQTQTLAHGFTHFTLSLHVFDCRWRAGNVPRNGAPHKWVRLAELENYPMGKTDRQIADWVRAGAGGKRVR